MQIFLVLVEYLNQFTNSLTSLLLIITQSFYYLKILKMKICFFKIEDIEN